MKRSLNAFRLLHGTTRRFASSSASQSTAPFRFRLWPFASFALIGSAGLLGAAELESRRQQRRRSRRQTRQEERRASQETAVALIGANLLLPALFFVSMRSGRSASVWRYISLSGTSPPVALLGHLFMHGSLMHLGFNMFALYTFSDTAHSALGRERFVAFYLATGMLAGVASLAMRARSPSALLVPSVGASGAIFGIVTATFLLHPNMHLMFIMFPFFSLPAFKLFPAVVLFDVVGALGLLRRFKLRLDHAGHLGGVVSGAALMAGIGQLHGVDVMSRCAAKIKNGQRR